MRKNIAFISLLTVLTISSCQREHKTNRTNDNSSDTLVDTNKIAIIPYKTTDNKVSETYKQIDLTDQEIKTIDSLLNCSVEKYNNDALKRFEKIKQSRPDLKLQKSDFIIELKDYKRQYTPVLNSKGERIVWIDCLCETMNLNWKKEKLLIKDGGKCFFSLTINLKTAKFTDIITHGNG